MSSYYNLLKACGNYTLFFVMVFICGAGIIYTKIQLDYTIGKWVEYAAKDPKKKFAEFCILTFVYAVGNALF